MKFATRIFVGLLAAASVYSQAETLKMGTEGAYAPFNLVNQQGQLEGFDIDIGNALCAEMKVECEWVTADWDGIIPALMSKKFDTIVASMSITDERKQKIDFTSKYYTSPVKFAQVKGSNVAITAEGLKGKVIGVQGSTVTENFVKGMFGKVAEIKAYGAQDEANLDFVSGRVDLIAADSFVLYDFLASKDGAFAEATGPDFDDPKYLGEGIGVGIRKGDDELKARLNKAIQAIRANGTYKKINEKYFAFDVYGAE
ncbi:MAG: arginine/ornithine transport system substrate-binding protein [Oleiphilaceae bacterium]|jgi:lysine-arginine-ornithine-binding protein